MASSGAGRGNAPGSAPPLRPSVMQQQQVEMIKKNRKCVSCGNTAMQKCDFRACGTCCNRNRNPCPIHGLKLFATGAVVAGAPSTPENQVRPQYQWAAAPPRIGMMPGYMRPPNGDVPSPYMNPAMMGYRMPYAARMPTPPPVETEAEKEARLERARKALIRQRREATTVNIARVNKMMAYADAELSFEDEAFDRYMRSAGLLEEVAGVDADIIAEGESFSAQHIVEDERLLDAALARHYSKHKEQQRQKLQKAITKSFQKLRKRDGDADVLEREFNQVGFGRRDTKKMKVHTADGKECLRRINAWEDFFQSIGTLSDIGDIRLLLDLYKKNFGRDLGTSLPHLFRKDAASAGRNEEREKGSLKDLGAVSNASEQPSATYGHNNYELQVTEQIKNQEAVKENVETQEAMQETEHQQKAAKQLEEAVDKQEAARQTDEFRDQQHSAQPTYEALDSAKQTDESMDQQEAEKQNNEAVCQLDKVKEQEPAEEALVHEEAAMHCDEGLAAAMQSDEALDEQGEAKEQQEAQVAKAEAQNQQDAAIHLDEILDQQRQEALDQKEAAVRSHKTPDQQEAVENRTKDGTAALEQEAENRLANAPRLPVRRLVMHLMKRNPLKVADCCKVDLDEESLRRVFDNHQKYYKLETME